MEYGPFCPKGVKGVIVSAFSKDSKTWEREEKICIGPIAPYASHRVLAPDVIRLSNGRFRMYFEGRNENRQESILSATSKDGLLWEVEPGVRLCDNSEKSGYGTPCCVEISRNNWRLYFHRRCKNRFEIISAISTDGIFWEIEKGVRVTEKGEEKKGIVYSPFVFKIANNFWIMVYAQWSGRLKKRGRILSAYSTDGLQWVKDPQPLLSPGGPFDSEHCSEPCLLRLNNGSWRLFYEGKDSKGRWRILGASADREVFSNDRYTL